MHLSNGEHHQFDTDEYEELSFAPIIKESNELNQRITTLFKVSSNIETDIVEVANKGNYDLLLIGISQSIFEGSLLGKILGFTTRIFNPESLLNQLTGKENLFEDSPFDERTKTIANKSKIPVGILIDKGFTSIETLFIPIFDQKDIFLIDYMQKLINNSESQITILDIGDKIKNNSELKEKIRVIEQKVPNHIQILDEKAVSLELLNSQNIMIVSIESWKKLVDSKRVWLPNIPSTLILKP